MQHIYFICILNFFDSRKKSTDDFFKLGLVTSSKSSGLVIKTKKIKKQTNQRIHPCIWQVFVFANSPNYGNLFLFVQEVIGTAIAFNLLSDGK